VSNSGGNSGGGGAVASVDGKVGVVTLTGSYDALGAATAVKGLPVAATGAVAATRFVGGTASVAPTAGTFLLGDYVITQAGAIFICTTAGTPGTWTQAGGGGAVSSVAGRTGAVVLTNADVAGSAPLASTRTLSPIGKSIQLASLPTTADITTAAAAGVTDLIVQAGWSTLQASAGAALTSTTSLITAIQNAITYGPLNVIIDAGYQYCPSWVTSAVEQFTDAAGNTYSQPGGGAGGNAVTNWMTSTKGRTYLSDYTTKLIALLASSTVTNALGQTVSALSVVTGVRVGGGFASELHYPRPIDGAVSGHNGSTFNAAAPPSTVTLTSVTGTSGGSALGTYGIIQSTDGSGVTVAFTTNSSGVLGGLTVLCGTTTVPAGTWNMQSVWGFGSNAQTGSNSGLSDTLASDQTVCPLPGYVPFVGPSRTAAKDGQWFAWYLNSLVVFEEYLLNLWTSLLNAQSYQGLVWVLHPDVGIRSAMPTTFPASTAVLPAYLGSAIEGVDHATTIAVYGVANSYPYGKNVYPDCTWIDQGITSNVPSVPWTQASMPVWAWVLGIAKANGVSARIMGENSSPPTNWTGVFAPGGPVASGYYGVLAVNSAPSSGALSFYGFTAAAAGSGTFAPARRVDVKVFGALGVGGDDTVFCQNAASFAKLTGAELYFPTCASFYGISSSLLVGGGSPGALKVSGDGYSSHIKLLNGANCYIFDTGSSGSPQFTPSPVFRDLYLDCNGANQTASSGGIYARGAVFGHFEHVWCEAPYEAGIRTYQDGLGNYGHHNRFINCLFQDGYLAAGSGLGLGLRLDNADENLVIGCTFQDCGTANYPSAQLYDTSAGLQTIIGNAFVTTRATTVAMIKTDSSPSGLSIIGNQFDTNTSGNLVEINGDQCSIMGNTFLNFGTANSAIHTSANYTKIIGNTFRAAGTTGHAVSEDASLTGNLIEGNTCIGTFASGRAFSINNASVFGNPGVANVGLDGTGMLALGEPMVAILAGGESILRRIEVTVNTIPLISGVVVFTSARVATKTEAITTITTGTGGVTPGTATVGQYGLYTVDASNNLTLVATTTNNTAMWSSNYQSPIAGSSVNVKGTFASYTKLAGVRYCVGLLWVGTGTVPQVYGIGSIGAGDTAWALQTPFSGAKTTATGLTTMPSTVAGTALTGLATAPLAVLLP
jgi:hypothetical protein